jgi:hypothetical protein
MKTLVPLFFMFLSINLSAESSGKREITLVGCHNYDNTCFLSLAGDPVGPEECQSNSVRWNKKNDPNGEATLTLATSAFYAGKKVTVYLANSCYADQPKYPTPLYISVNK